MQGDSEAVCEIIERHGYQKASLIGFATAHPGFPFSHDKLKEVIERVTSEKFREVSLKIFERAFSEGRKSIKP